MGVPKLEKDSKDVFERGVRMAEYIEREAVLAKQYNASNFVNPMLAEMVVDVGDIEDIPAANVVEVVRCKDCQEMIEKGWCSLHQTPMNINDFCSYGGRRAE